MSVKAYSNNNMNNELQLIQEVSHISSKVLKMMLVSLTMFTGLWFPILFILCFTLLNCISWNEMYIFFMF